MTDDIMMARSCGGVSTMRHVVIKAVVDGANWSLMVTIPWMRVGRRFCRFMIPTTRLNTFATFHFPWATS